MSKRSKSKRFVKQSEDAFQPNNGRKNTVRTMAKAENQQGEER